ncbi:hypothetical protein [Pseudomonas sp. GD03730]|uniref:hypothetical protein n=1 Tax=Pseudomonas sp. GD03730 TaxID=2975375 RepID=UPI00244D222A|nr:hypothetical protein [Pseudomonas sp. GD03730]MDH1403711.1 hypothetical protein [Pseudomonas sp. GD03730]
MSNEYFNPPSRCDDADAIERVRREIDRRIWTREGDDVAVHLAETRLYLTGYLSGLELFGVISVDTFNQLDANIEHQLEQAQGAADEDDE